MGKRGIRIILVLFLNAAFGIFCRGSILLGYTLDRVISHNFETTLSPSQGTNGIILGADLKISRNPLTNSLIGLKVNLTNNNPLLEKATMVSLNAKWLPYWRFSGVDMGLNITARGGILDIDTQRQPIDPPYPSQVLGGEEVGLSIGKALGRLSLSGDISQYITYTRYSGIINKDNSGKQAAVRTKMDFSPFFIGARWVVKRRDYNPDKYFFLDEMRGNEYTLQFDYIKKRLDLGLFYTLNYTDWTEYSEEKSLAGLGVGYCGWKFKSLIVRDLTGGLDSITVGLGRNFGRLYYLETYWTWDTDISQTLSGNTIGFAFGYGLGKDLMLPSSPESFNYHKKYEDNPFSPPEDFESFDEAIENLDSLGKVVRYTRAHIDYIGENGFDRRPEEVFESRGGDCDEQVFFQHYILNKHNFGDIYEIGFQSPKMCHAFSFGRDRKSGEEYIWEYGKVFRLNFEDGDKLSLKEKVASILSSRSYTRDWEWFVTYGPELNYEDYYDDEAIAAEGFRTAPELFSGDGGSVGIIPESGIQLFIGEEFEK